MLTRTHLVAITVALLGMALGLVVDFLTPLPDAVALTVLALGLVAALVSLYYDVDV